MEEGNQNSEMERHSVLMEPGLWEKIAEEAKLPENGRRPTGNHAGYILKKYFEDKEAAENGKTA